MDVHKRSQSIQNFIIYFVHLSVRASPCTFPSWFKIEGPSVRRSFHERNRQNHDCYHHWPPSSLRENGLIQSSVQRWEKPWKERALWGTWATKKSLAQFHLHSLMLNFLYPQIALFWINLKGLTFWPGAHPWLLIGGLSICNYVLQKKLVLHSRRVQP